MPLHINNTDVQEFKIDEIEISNFKFFPKIDDKNKAIKVDGKHLLIYGENGSGKSSIYWALYTLLECANKDNNEIKKYFEYDGKENLLNINAIQLPAPNDKKAENAHIKLKLKGSNITKYKVSYDDIAINTDEQASISNYASEFINYRALYSAFNFAHSEEVDLYQHFKYTVFPYVKFDDPCTIFIYDNEDKSWKEKIVQEANPIINFLENGAFYTINAKEKKQYSLSTEQVKKIKEYVNKIKDTLHKTITHINTKGNEILNELGYRDFDFYVEDILKTKESVGRVSFSPPKIKILLKNKSYQSHNSKVHRVHSFFNEAKLTAISLAIRLALLEKRPTKAEVKILVLDDLLLSLDMNNRTKVIDYVFQNYLEKYQVFFFTHDKALNAFVKLKINEWSNKDLWEFKEMYAGSTDKPIILEEHLDEISKAEKYKDAYDYYSSGNNIRKAIEEKLKDLLPITIQTITKDLQDELNWLFKYYDECKVGHLIPDKVRTQLLNYKDIVFNPASHFDLKSPIYLSELEKAFDIHTVLGEIPKIKRTLLAGIGSSLFYTNTEKNYIAEYSLLENLYLIQVDGISSVITDPIHKCVQYTESGIIFLDKKTGNPKTVEKIKNVTDVKINFTERCNKIKTYLELENLPIFQQDFTFSDNKNIQTKLAELNAPPIQ